LDDPWVKRAAGYLLACRGQGPKRLRRNPPKSFLEVHAAFEVFTGRQTAKAILEAWLLTGASLERVAGEMGLSPETIEAYERLFYAVRELAGARDAVVAAIHRSLEGTPDALGRLGFALRTLASTGGELALEALLPVLDDCRRLLADPEGEASLTEPLSMSHLALLSSAVDDEELGLKQWLYLQERSNEYERLQRERETLEELLAYGACGQAAEESPAIDERTDLFQELEWPGLAEAA
jgi:hypothetical protein